MDARSFRYLKGSPTNWGYVLILIIFTIIVGGGILGYSKYVFEEISSLSRLPEIEMREKIKDETANWKTYRNEKYGFEVKYLENFTIIENYPNTNDIRFRPDEKYSCTFQITVSDKTFEEYKEFLEGTDPILEISSEGEIFVNNYKGLELIYVPFEGGGESRYVLLSNHSKTYVIICYFIWSPCDEIFNQMLSTFRFLE